MQKVQGAQKESSLVSWAIKEMGGKRNVLSNLQDSVNVNLQQHRISSSGQVSCLSCKAAWKDYKWELAGWLVRP